MDTKNNVLFVGLLGVALGLVSSLPSFYTFCFQGGHCWRLWETVNSIGSYFFIFPPLLLLSLITYRMHDSVFRAWFHFAVWFVPVIIAATFLLQHVGGGGGWGISSGIFEFVVLWLLYIILIVVSLIQITRAYLKTKVK